MVAKYVLWFFVLVCFRFAYPLPVDGERESEISDEGPEPIDEVESMDFAESKRSLPEVGKTIVGVPLRRSSIPQHHPIPSEPKTERALKREDLSVGTSDEDQSPVSDTDVSEQKDDEDSGSGASGAAAVSGLSEAGVVEGTEAAMQNRPMNRPNVQRNGNVLMIEDPTLFNDANMKDMNMNMNDASMNDMRMMYHNGESGSGAN